VSTPTSTVPRDERLPAEPGEGARVCGSCRKTRLSDYNPGTMCSPCERALFDREHLACPGDDLATWVWDTAPMREALARLDFQAVLVIYRAAAGVSRRELGARAGLSESVIWYWEAGRRQGIYDIRQLLQLADALKAPRLALLPVILGQPRALSDIMPGPAARPAGSEGHG
jgi:Helix-turn-helix domain